MSIAMSLLPEFEREMATTRRVLERIPDEKLDWKAHPKSNTIAWVGSHLANIPDWAVATLSQDHLDLHPVGGQPYRTDVLKSRQAILEKFDANVVAAKARLATTSDDDMLKPWSLMRQGQVMFTIPKVAVIRTWVLNHSIHHRAHLCVYFRLIDVPVPAIYGPSADEQPG